MLSDRTLYEQTPALMHVIDPEGHIIAVSDRWLAVLGYGRGEVIGTLWQTFLTPDSQVIAARYFPVSDCSTGSVQDVLLHFMKGDGEVLAVYLSSTFVQDGASPSRYGLAVLTEVAGVQPSGAVPLSYQTDLAREACTAQQAQVEQSWQQANRHRKLAELAWPESENRLRLIAETIQDSFWLDDVKTRRPLYDSSNFETLWGISPESIQNGFDPLLDCAYPPDRAGLQDWIENTFVNLVPSEIEFRIQHPNGEVRWLHERCFPLLNQAGMLHQIVGVTTDITARKQTEASIRQYERIVSAMPDPVCLIDRDYTYRLVNQAHQDWLSHCFHEVGVSVVDVIGIDFFERVTRPRLDQALAGETLCFEEWAYNPSQTEEEFISITYAPYYEMDGTISGVVVSIRNLTALKQTRDRLTQTAERLQLHIANSPLAFIEWDMDLRVQCWSSRTTALFGWPLAEVMSKHFSEFPLFVPEDLSQMSAYFEELHHSSVHHQAVLMRNLTRAGEVIYCEWYNSALLDDAGNLVSIVSLIQAVTQRYQTQLALKESEERWQLALRGSNEGIWDWQIDPATFFFSARWKELLDYADHELSDDYQTWESLVHPEDLPTVLAQLEAHLCGKTPNYSAEYRMRSKSGAYKWMLARAKAIFDEAGNPTRIVGSHSDVTERHQAEDALRQSEARFQRLAANMPGVIYRYHRSPEGSHHFSYVSPACHEIWGVTSEAIYQDAAIVWNLIHSEDRANLEAAIEISQQRQTPLSEEFRIITPAGQLKWLQMIARPDPDVDQQLLWDGIVTDITERKETDQALRKSEALNTAILGALPDLLLRIRCDGLFLEMHYPNHFHVVCPKESAVGRKTQDVLPAEIVDKRMDIIHQALDTQTIQIYEYQISIGDQVRWEEARIVPLSTDEVLVLVRDIDERKQAEQEVYRLNKALEQQNQCLEELIEQRTSELMTFMNALPDQILVVDRTTNQMLFVNDSVAQFSLRNNRKDLENKTVFECFPPDQAEYYNAQNHKVFRTGQVLHVEDEIETPQGLCYFDTYKIPLKRPDGSVYALIVTARDVTELVKARQTLATQANQLEATNQELQSFSYSVSHDLRAPLRHINGFIAALRQHLRATTETDVEVAHYLEIISQSSRKMGLLIDGLLVLARVSRRELVLRPIALRPLVENTLALLEIPLDQPEKLQIRLDDLPIVHGDATLLQQVFTNLLDNAVKFSRDRTPAQICIGQCSDGTLFVKDNGVGFDIAYADKLFSPFQCLHNQAQFQGMGIGLAIVQRIIHRHGGRIWVESAPDQGTTVFFILIHA
ncbi:MAG: PAS domain S-box protein [Leptolyngbya sp. SIO1D8]|nr:PAS domain S-box protein [Leptolyngbya sp. SIO1D8]